MKPKLKCKKSKECDSNSNDIKWCDDNDSYLWKGRVAQDYLKSIFHNI